MTTLCSRIGLLVLAVGAAAPAAAGPCDTPAHRQFDFWLGDWDVKQPDGTPVGRNLVTREQGGCALRERYSTPRAYAGESLNAYDPGRGTWHQTWIDNAGLLLQLEGGWRDGAMVLEGRTTAPDGKVMQHRLTWTPRPDGSVRQHWEQRAGDGAWTTAFDGRYTKR